MLKNKGLKVTENLTPIQSLKNTSEKVVILSDANTKTLDAHKKYLEDQMETIEFRLNELIDKNIGDLTNMPESIKGDDAAAIINKIYTKLII